MGVMSAVDVYFISGAADSVTVPYFAIFMSVWSTAYLEAWKRRNAVLCVRWGMAGFEQEEQDRPQFSGREFPDAVTGKPRLEFDRRKYVTAVLVSLATLFFLAVLLLGIMVSIIYFRRYS